jgi:thiol-disulfide isomerase/thioredoxin
MKQITTLKKSAVLVVCVFLFHSNLTFGQSVIKPNKDSEHIRIQNISNPLVKQSSITFHLEKIAGIGPEGFSSEVIGTKSLMHETEEYKAYPDMKNKPANLNEVMEYFLIMDRPQFYYQNYIAGIYTKNFLIIKLHDLKFSLSDTISLSKKPVKCYVSVLTGINDNKDHVYIVDANNNGDFADDVLKPLLKNVHDEDVMINEAIPVETTYFSNGEIKAEKKPVFIQQDRYSSNFRLSFAFPEFKYCRFFYKGKPYLISTGGNPGMSYVTVIPDRPHFVSIGMDKRLSKDQFVQIDDADFKISNIANDYSAITLTGNDITGFSTGFNSKASPARLSDKKAGMVVSRQKGFKAPLITGFNINSNNTSVHISTNNLKSRYTFLDFWSTYCGPCIDEFKYLEEVYLKYNRSQIEIIGVVDDRDKNTTLQILKDHNVGWPNIITGAKGSFTIGYEDINSFPTTFLLDAEGKIIAVDLRGDALMNKLKTLMAAK